jgi:hypothetical protein
MGRFDCILNHKQEVHLSMYCKPGYNIANLVISVVNSDFLIRRRLETQFRQSAEYQRNEKLNELSS